MLAPWKKSYDKPGQHSKKQRHHFGTKVLLVKVMVFPVVTYGCESWTIKKAERWRIDAFELWCWSRLLRVPWTARGSNQSILKEISPEYSLEGLMLRLKLQYFGHLMWRTDSLEKTLMLGGIGGRKRRGRQWMRWLDGITDSMDMSSSKLWIGDGQGSLGCCSPWGCKELDMTELLNWTECTLKNTTIFKTYEVLCKIMEFFLIINHRIFDEKLWQSSTYQQSKYVSDLNQVFCGIA